MVGDALGGRAAELPVLFEVDTQPGVIHRVITDQDGRAVLTVVSPAVEVDTALRVTVSAGELTDSLQLTLKSIVRRITADPDSLSVGARTPVEVTFRAFERSTHRPVVGRTVWFSALGGVVQPSAVLDESGTCRTTFIVGDQPGAAWVIGRLGDLAPDSVHMELVEPVAVITLRSGRRSIRGDGIDTTLITARVANALDQPAPGVWVQFTSDRGLCGAYNNRVVEATLKLLSGNADKDCRVFAVGRKGILRLRQAGYEVHRAYEDVFNPVRFDTAQTIRDELESVFLRGEVDEVLAVFTEYFNPARQVVITRRLLPCPPDTHPEEIRRHYERELPEGLDLEEIETAQVSNVYIHEPDYESVGHRLLEQNLGLLVYRALLEAQASEHGARMVAMDNATENAEDMIAELTLRMNRLRQESITREMLDVVGGAEALRD